MADLQTPAPTTVPKPTPASGKPPAGDQGNPLDALEQILNEAKSKAGAADDKKKKEDEAALVAKQEEEAKLAEYNRIKEEKKIEDAANIRDHIAGLQNIGNTPEEQARMQQVQEKKDAADQKAQDLEESEIHQLGHTKI